MSPLLQIDVGARSAIANGALKALADALSVELEPLERGRLVIPDQKARLTRVGGRCGHDGTLLAFDPFLPHEHRCDQCGRVYRGQEHDDWWAMGAQLWTAERAVQAASLYLLRKETSKRDIAVRILGELSNRYTTWPNRDNVLGPTRPFFSTYLESIWLLNLCHAVSLLERAEFDHATASVLSAVRDQLIQPSRDLIASYHEGRSNRQVWNEVAVLSASLLLGDNKAVDRRLDSSKGLHSLIETGLLDDGTWYEGENYHLFAHRGLWYGVHLLRAIGRPLNDKLEARYRAGFVTPFMGVLPDDTIPSRRDSQYAVSIRQWRFAEWCELGIAHAINHDTRADVRLSGTLKRLYTNDTNVPLHFQARHPYSTADAERNEPAGLLSRADLSWRALLMAVDELPSARHWSPGSVCLPSQGLAVIRREEGQLYVALEGGHTGGGHGHPDRLALTLQHGRTRFLEDPGTGSYVERKLHWYRSTLAHAAPVIDGASQDAVPAELLAFEDRGWAGWIRKRVRNMKPGVDIERTVVVCEGHVIDLLEWKADREVQIDLPLGRNVEAPFATMWKVATPGGAGGLEDGFDFLDGAEVDSGEPFESSHHDASDTQQRPAESMNAWSGVGNHFSGVLMPRTEGPTITISSTNRFQLWRALAPGAPGCDADTLYWMRTRGRAGAITQVWLWLADSELGRGPVSGMNGGGSVDQHPLTVSLADGTSATHSRTDAGWHIDLKAGNATSSIDLELLPIPQPAAKPAGTENLNASRRTFAAATIPSAPLVLTFELGEAHYFRTEESWSEAGEPRATVWLQLTGSELRVIVASQTGTPNVPASDSENKLDNERRDVNSDGVQLHIGPSTADPWRIGWLAVPAPETAPDARVSALTADSPSISTQWQPTQGGWTMTLHIPIETIPRGADGIFAMEVIVNERPAGRVRRRGQLRLSGGGGFAYLRGDRTESAEAMTFTLPQA